MPSITVHIAPSGNPLNNGGSSLTGHMWFSINNGNGSISSYGFAPRNEGEPHGDREVKRNDKSHYLSPPYNYETGNRGHRKPGTDHVFEYRRFV